MKKIFTLVLSCLMVTAMSAQTVSKEVAAQKAAKIFQSECANARGGEAVVPQLTYTSEMDGVTCFYVFNNPEGGYAIIGGDAVAREVLATSNHGQFEMSKLNPSAKWLLADLAYQIATAKKTTGDSYDTTDWRGDADVSPILGGETGIRWDQNSPFNDQCPILSGTEHCATGCVATATAQVVRHFSYPAQAKSTKVWQNRTAGATAYDWENMPYNFKNISPTEAQKTAVATLCADLGAFCEMTYGEESSSDESSMLEGLQTYMDYSGEYAERNGKTSEEWEKLAYNSLVAGCALIYGGDSCGKGGHCFVVDGYRKSDGLFHVNWGWNDENDGYYAMSGSSAFIPTGEAGTGGGMGKYFSNHDMAYNVKPNGSYNAISSVTEEVQASGKAVKKVVNGQIVISKEDKQFNALGQKM